MDYGFWLKKAVSLYIHPLTIAMEAITFGVVLIGFSRRRSKKASGPRAEKIRRLAGDIGVGLTIFGVFFLFLCSIKPVADPLIFALEKQYPPPRTEHTSEMAGLRPAFIVVLAGGARFDPDKPPTSQPSYETGARVLEGVRLSRFFPDAKVVFTGSPNENEAMTRFAGALGLDTDRIVNETESRDTKDHPVMLKPILGESEFLLVTSGSHMPRAVGLFEGQGLKPIPFACDFWVWPRFGEENPYEPKNMIPRMEALEMTHKAFHEYLGIAWAKWAGQFPAPPSVPIAELPSGDLGSGG
ncbi:MAG: YdcF family protein, partial [Verrucomicrobiae bacterium]|nr:YdcF family protein [Verrucomicrobiae bacterium]